jgi:hypothetical protein
MAANGRLPASSLRRIYHPSLKLYLDRNAARAWEAMRLRIKARTGRQIYPGGPDSAYRTLPRQRYWRNYWCGQGKCGNAAVPGTSNHGIGRAVDVPTPRMRMDIERHGDAFGWQKRWSDAAHEVWHYRYRPGVYKPTRLTPAQRRRAKWVRSLAKLRRDEKRQGTRRWRRAKIRLLKRLLKRR